MRRLPSWSHRIIIIVIIILLLLLFITIRAWRVSVGLVWNLVPLDVSSSDTPHRHVQPFVAMTLARTRVSSGAAGLSCCTAWVVQHITDRASRLLLRCRGDLDTIIILIIVFKRNIESRLEEVGAGFGFAPRPSCPRPPGLLVLTTKIVRNSLTSHTIKYSGVN